MSVPDSKNDTGGADVFSGRGSMKNKIQFTLFCMLRRHSIKQYLLVCDTVCYSGTTSHLVPRRINAPVLFRIDFNIFILESTLSEVFNKSARVKSTPYEYCYPSAYFNQCGYRRNNLYFPGCNVCLHKKWEDTIQKVLISEILVFVTKC